MINCPALYNINFQYVLMNILSEVSIIKPSPPKKLLPCPMLDFGWAYKLGPSLAMQDKLIRVF